MKLTTGILAAAMMTGGVWAQNPNIINNVQSKMAGVQQKQTDDSNAALGEASASSSAKPTAGAPASAVKPAPIPSSKPVAATAKGAESAANNKLERVNVVRNANDIQIEIHSRETVTARVSKLRSPERVVVELPATVMATSQSKIAVGSAGVKGVRIAMNGKTPPTTSIVVDLEQPLGYELTPGPSDRFVLTLHTQESAKSATPPVPVKTSAPQLQAAAVKPVAPPAPLKATKVASVAAPAPAQVSTPQLQRAALKPAAASSATDKKSTKVASAAPVAPKVATAAVAAPAAKKTSKPEHAAATKIAADEKAAGLAPSPDALKTPKPEEKKWAMTGKRDPFFSPVVQQQSGSGCSTGKKCLEIGQINVRGVVKADSGFIAVVTNSMNKAYFLHENDPVFNGYVMRITGDSVVFQETVQDKLGKPVTHEVTKRIVTPAV
ncbi:MAG: AMIN domain-containing protein [Acidobacteriaceae bacterium]